MVDTLETVPDSAPAWLRGMITQMPRTADSFLASSPERDAYGLMRIATDIRAGSLIDLFTPAARPQAARPVLKDLEQAARERDCRSLVWSVADSPRSAAMEPVLHSLGWDQGCHLRTFHMDLARVAQAPWVTAQPRSGECEIVPWMDLGAGERNELKAARWYPASLSPFPQEPYIEPRCSLALRYRGEVAGWSVSTQHGPNQAYAAVIFVREDLQARGVGAALISDTLRRAASAGLESLVFEVEPQRAAMLRFADRRLRPYLIEETNIYRTWKMLS